MMSLQYRSMVVIHMFKKLTNLLLLLVFLGIIGVVTYRVVAVNQDSFKYQIHYTDFDESDNLVYKTLNFKYLNVEQLDIQDPGLSQLNVYHINFQVENTDDTDYEVFSPESRVRFYSEIDGEYSVLQGYFDDGLSAMEANTTKNLTLEIEIPKYIMNGDMAIESVPIKLYVTPPLSNRDILENGPLEASAYQIHIPTDVK